MENPEFVAGKRGQAIQLVGPVGGDPQHVHIPDLSLTSDNVTWMASLNGSSNHTRTGIMMSRGTNDTGMGYGQGGALHYTWTGDTTWNWHNGSVIANGQKPTFRNSETKIRDETILITFSASFTTLRNCIKAKARLYLG